ncbi:hypothetical protein MWU52_14005 [Jannaschia sp. S6380]|uniref:hypothetical protein n=1 Tax=Jannaschia sp. S6380 TaxID=2926408 RepID=UPI001FF6FC35|nr:hypothetical protein [Jannaschia sp. S6380]MCK0168669.1 hypothetical protein [Jannaschia sp. S6380]
MSWTLHRIAITAGRYRGLLRGDGAPPDLRMELDGETVGDLTAVAVESGWQVEGEIGRRALSEGTGTVVIRTADGQVLDSLTIVCGLSAPEDLRAELGALRAELSILKAAFRRLASGG